MSDIFEFNGIKFISKNDLIVSKIRDQKTDFELETTQYVFSNLESGKTFVDVGHSTGWFSLQVAAKGFKVIGFEPMTPAYNRAIENMKLNNLSYDIFNAAASNVNGETLVYFNPQVPITTGASLEKCVRSNLNRNFVKVKTVRLDDILMDEQICVIKIDVEGHELSVLEGAVNIIQKNKPKLILEANDTQSENMLSDWLAKQSYTYRMVDDRNMLCDPL